MKKRNLVLTCTLATLLSACGDDSSTSDSVNPATRSSGELSATVESLYPNFSMDAGTASCDSSENDLVGCYVSEKCSPDGNGSQLFVVDFTKEGSMTTSALFFQESQTCSEGHPYSFGRSLLTYETGAQITSESGLPVSELNISDDSSTEATTTNYYSSFYLDNERLCFPTSEYAWGDVKTGLIFKELDESQRPTNINFDNCLIRIK